MKLTTTMLEKVEENLHEKKKANPLRGKILGIGVNLRNSMNGATVFKNNYGVCSLEELSRMIEELTMLKEAIEEEAGIVL